jgi:sugar/nucleoside kinase (ribokinase family)
MSRVAVAGVISVCTAVAVESFPVPYEPNLRRPGGIDVRLASVGWTVARTLQSLGTDVTFATYVGSDSLGHLAMHELRAHSLYGPATLVCSAQPRTVVLYDGSGRRAGVRDLRFPPEQAYPVDVFTLALAGCEMAVLTNTGFVRGLIPVTADRGVPIATDVHLVSDTDTGPHRDWLWAAHVLACSHERLPRTPETWIRDLWRRVGTDIVLVGCGSGGAVVGLRETRAVWHVQPTTPRGVRYTSGAGDTLLSAFVHHYLDCGDPVTALRWAVLIAGWKVGGGPEDGPGVEAVSLPALRAAHGLPEVRRLR